MTDVKLMLHSELPDHVLEHLHDLEERFLCAIYPLVENQRMDIVLSAMISATSKLLVTACKDDLVFVEDNMNHFVAAFMNHLKCDVENRKRMNQKEKK